MEGVRDLKSHMSVSQVPRSSVSPYFQVFHDFLIKSSFYLHIKLFRKERLKMIQILFGSKILYPVEFIGLPHC